ncbi:MAG: hypothetical protein ACI9N9_002414 [Enterobacterales bacterium]|jgi:hypothetical protein
MTARKVSQNIVYWLMVALFLTGLSFASIPLKAVEKTDDTSAKSEAPEQTQTPNVAVNSPELEQQLDSTRNRLGNLLTSEQRKQILLIQLQNELVNVETDGQKEQLENRIRQLSIDIVLIRDEFNLTLTGGIDEVKLITDVEEVYNWRTDLEEIMKPIFRSMKGVTEKPREIESLRSKISVLKRNIELSKSALSFIEQLNSTQLPDEFLQRITQADTDWSNRLVSLEQELEIVQFQLQTRLVESANFFKNFGETLRDFAKGRGSSIVLALFAFWSVWFFFSMLRRGYRHVAEKRKLTIASNLSSRIFYYAYQIFASLIALTALLLVFYVQGDWIMLGVSMLILATIFFSIKNYFPKFVVETKLLLNIGPVREGERVFYDGIPWKVEKIGVYTMLFNPLLSGGRIRVQLKELVDMNSRESADCESWFPCREGDMLLMPEGRLVKVEFQSPEFVKLNYTGGATTTVRTDDFLSLSFTNLSEESFRVSSFFGIDYSLQKISTTRVQSIFREAIQEYIESQNYGKYLKVLRVEFHEASSSALTYKIISDFHGIAARHHNIIARALQTAAVDVCNKHKWTIPFKQLTLHQAEAPIEGS